jgi:hypothetical protein
VSVLDRSNCLDKFGLYTHFQKNSERTTNAKILGNFVTFLTVGRTLNSDLKRRNYDRLKLNDIKRCDFPFELISSFLRFFNLPLIERFSKFILFMQMHMQHHDICWSYTLLTKRKALSNIYGVRIVSHGRTHPRSQF